MATRRAGQNVVERSAGLTTSKELLWRDFFKNPSQWNDNRKNKTNPRAPDFKHKSTKDCLWIDGRQNPPWVQQELMAKGLWTSPNEGQESEGVGSQFVTLLRACAKKRNLKKGEKLHADILKAGLLEKNSYLANNVISMYAKCGAFDKAEQVLNGLSDRNVISWSGLIAGYVQYDRYEEALRCFERMQHDGISPDAVLFSCVLKACGNLRNIEEGEKVHNQVKKLGLIEKDVILGNALIYMYAQCGALSRAQEVFDVLPVRDVYTWTTLISSYVQYDRNQEAISFYEEMQREGISPNMNTSTCVLKAYANCGNIEKAQQVFDVLPSQDVVSWSTLIAGYVKDGQAEEALVWFDKMQSQGVTPNAITFTSVLKACGTLGAAEKGEKIHSEVAKKGLLNKDVVLGNSLIDMYVNCGLLVKARRVLLELPKRDASSWNILIAGYSQQGKGEEALECLRNMQADNLSPNAATCTSILKACGIIGAVDIGEKIHAEIRAQGLLTEDITLGNALVAMYSRCGLFDKAEAALRELPSQNAASWTALIAGYALHGQGREALNCFQRMLDEGVRPDAMTFSSVLNACSQNDLLDEAEIHYSNMTSKYGILPDSAHHTSMIDIYCHTGNLDKAVELVKKMPTSAQQIPMWRAILGSCRAKGNVNLGKIAFEHIINMDKKHAAAYILMSNIYADAGMQEDADSIEAMQVKNDAWKMAGRSCWTDSLGTVHSFVFRDKRHPQCKEIYAKLEELDQNLLGEAHSSGLNMMLQGISDNAKDNALCGHSEKLALACALINTTPGAPIRVVKNMRMCQRCHVAITLISKVENREIVVRDASRFHVFQDGKCNCENCW